MRYAEVRDAVVIGFGEAVELPPNCVDISNVDNVDLGWTWDGTSFSAPDVPSDRAPSESWRPSLYRARGSCLLEGFAVPDPSSFTVSFSGGRIWTGSAVVEIPSRGLQLNDDGTHEIFIFEHKTIRARRKGKLPDPTDIVLFDVTVDVPVDPVKPVKITDRRTFLDTGARRPLRLLDAVKACQITSGVYAGAFRTSDKGGLRWAEVNEALYPWADEIGSDVRAHLSLQLALFDVTGSSNWTALHGTAWTAQVRWPYDLVSVAPSDPTDFYSGTVTARRAGHARTATSFLRLAVRCATTSAAGLTWWNANYPAIWAFVSANLLAPLVPLPDAGAADGRFVAAYQDLAIAQEIATEDMVRTWRALRDALSLMTGNGGTQASDATSAASVRNDLAKGLRNAWRADANVAGDSGWVAPTFRNGWRVNNHRSWSDVRLYLVGLLYGAAWGNAATEIGRQARGWDIVFRRAPRWWSTANVTEWDGEAATALAAAGAEDIAREALAFAHQTYPPSPRLSDVGRMRYLQRLLRGESL